jgi:hypothetical protein
MRTRRGFGGRAGHFKPSKCGRRFRHTTSDLSSAFASFRSRVSNPSVNQSYTGASSSRACRTLPWSRQKRARPDQARLEANSVAAMVAHSVARSRLPADGVPADTNNRHCRDHPQRGAGEREPMRSQSLRRWRQSGALHSNRLCLPTKSATNAGTSPSGGFLLARLCLKSDGVMIGFWTCKPRLSVDRSRARRAHHLVL